MRPGGNVLTTAAAIALLAVAIGCGDNQPEGAPTESERATFFGADAGDNASAIAAGDFNGDGVLDIVLAAAAAAGPDNGRPDGGEAYVFLGPFVPGERRDAADGEYDLVIYGAHPGDQLGRALAAGDFNGDGTDDIVLGAPFADGPEGARPDSGQVYIVLGSARLGSQMQRLDLAEGGQDATVFGADAKDLAGFALHAADVNGDGSTDLIIGAFWADGPENGRSNAGEVYVVYGGSNRGQFDLAMNEQDVTIYGAESEDRLGETVGAGDVNGDGLADLIMAATFADGPDNERDASGETYIVTSPPPQRLDLARERPQVAVLGIDPGDQIGHSIASGDVDGDGLDDIFLGAVSADGPENGADLAGEAYLVLSGERLPPDIDMASAGEATALIYGAAAKSRLGRSAATGDINGDGLEDLLISAPDVEDRRGAVYVFYGRGSGSSYPQTAAQADLTLKGFDEGDTLGQGAFARPALTTADINGDGLAEILVAAPSADGPGKGRADAGEAYIVFLER